MNSEQVIQMENETCWHLCSTTNRIKTSGRMVYDQKKSYLDFVAELHESLGYGYHP